jgi:hypothetical protein
MDHLVGFFVEQETVGMTETNERADRPATDAEEVAFWGLGLFPVL